MYSPLSLTPTVKLSFFGAGFGFGFDFAFGFG
jgi:hypothetical protein